MLRILAALAFAVSIDLFWFDGRYSHAVEQVAISIIQHF
jgi:hypothetical protein